jgi:hypothetical protein
MRNACCKPLWCILFKNSGHLRQTVLVHFQMLQQHVIVQALIVYINHVLESRELLILFIAFAKDHLHQGIIEFLLVLQIQQ